MVWVGKYLRFAISFMQRYLSEYQNNRFYRYVCEKHNLYLSSCLTETDKVNLLHKVFEKSGKPIYVFMDCFFGFCFNFDYDNASFLEPEELCVLESKLKRQLRECM